ncbi:uncharacterized protein [Medicago truncatula]|uniref:uncharacterized protein n=1 Tax=Medicago truncatula TaxID=3880 RepID=UPI00196852C7|nr:uncharacterized protein LOC120578365 [Medicago truncatula]
MCRGCLLTRVRLLYKGVVCPTNCASCDSTHEDLHHVFFDFPFAIHVWNRTGLWSSIQHALASITSVVEAIFSLLETLSVELGQQLATVLWSIWKNRNLRVWEDVAESSAIVVERARNMVEDWNVANSPSILASATSQQLFISTEGEVSPPPPQPIPRWRAPTPGRYKCNIDAAFSSHLNRTGIGICIRDYAGIFVSAKGLSYSCYVSTDVGEALGLHSDLQWLDGMHFDNVDFETDSKLTVEFVRRQANGIARALARVALLLASPAVYYNIPDCIETLIINEML